MVGYRTRFVRQEDAAELVNLYHLARIPLSGKDDSKYQRMLWASAAFAQEHPEVTETGAYKDLDGLLY